MRNRELSSNVVTSLIFVFISMIATTAIFIAPVYLAMYLTGTIAHLVPVLITMILSVVIAIAIKLTMGIN